MLSFYSKNLEKFAQFKNIVSLHFTVIDAWKLSGK